MGPDQDNSKCPRDQSDFFYRPKIHESTALNVPVHCRGEQSRNEFGSATLLVCTFSCKIARQDSIEIRFVNSRTVNRRPFRIFSQIVATPSFLDDVDGLPERGSSSVDRRLSSKRLKHSKVKEPLNDSCLKAVLNYFRAFQLHNFYQTSSKTR